MSFFTISSSQPVRRITRVKKASCNGISTRPSKLPASSMFNALQAGTFEAAFAPASILAQEGVADDFLPTPATPSSGKVFNDFLSAQTGIVQRVSASFSSFRQRQAAAELVFESLPAEMVIDILRHLSGSLPDVAAADATCRADRVPPAPHPLPCPPAPVRTLLTYATRRLRHLRQPPAPTGAHPLRRCWFRPGTDRRRCRALHAATRCPSLWTELTFQSGWLPVEGDLPPLLCERLASASVLKIIPPARRSVLRVGLEPPPGTLPAH